MTTLEYPFSIPARRLSRQSRDSTGQRLLVRQAEMRADQSQEGLGVAQQVISLPGGNCVRQAGFGSGPFGCAGGEAPGPLGEFRCHLGEDRPYAAWTAAAGTSRAAGTCGLGPSPCRQHGSTSPQCRQMSSGEALRCRRRRCCFSQAAAGLIEQVEYGVPGTTGTEPLDWRRCHEELLTAGRDLPAVTVACGPGVEGRATGWTITRTRTRVRSCDHSTPADRQSVNTEP